MNIRILLLILPFISIPCVFAQGLGQSSSDSGVLVSGNGGGSSGVDLTGQESSNSPGDQGRQRSDGNSGDTSSASTDPIVIKAANAMMFQVNANMKLSQDQQKAVSSIIQDYIVKVRALQLSLEKGDIDGRTMYGQREQLFKDEDRELSLILTQAQMNIWANIQKQ
jgi:hypothetical protein